MTVGWLFFRGGSSWMVDFLTNGPQRRLFSGHFCWCEKWCELLRNTPHLLNMSTLGPYMFVFCESEGFRSRKSRLEKWEKTESSWWPTQAFFTSYPEPWGR